MQIIAQTVLRIASDVLGAPLAEETVMTDVPEWDSLKTLQIVMALDEAGLSIPLERIAEVKGVPDLIRFAQQRHA